MLRENLRDWDRTLVWHAFTQMAEYEPLVIERAEGCVLIDIDGNRYIDGVSSLWCNIHGHRHPKIDAAIRAQLDRVAHVTNLGARIRRPSGWPSGWWTSRRRGCGTSSSPTTAPRRSRWPEDGLPVLAAAARTRGRRRAAIWPSATRITATRWAA